MDEDDERMNEVQKAFFKHAVIPTRHLGEVLRDLGVSVTVKDVWILEQGVKMGELTYKDFVQFLDEHGLVPHGMMAAAKGGGDEDEQPGENEGGEEMNKTKKNLNQPVAPFLFLPLLFLLDSL